MHMPDLAKAAAGIEDEVPAQPASLRGRPRRRSNSVCFMRDFCRGGMRARMPARDP